MDRCRVLGSSWHMQNAGSLQPGVSPLFSLPGTSRLQGWVPRQVGDAEEPQLQGQKEPEALKNPEDIT